MYMDMHELALLAPAAIVVALWMACKMVQGGCYMRAGWSARVAPLTIDALRLHDTLMSGEDAEEFEDLEMGTSSADETHFHFSDDTLFGLPPIPPAPKIVVMKGRPPPIETADLQVVEPDPLSKSHPHDYDEFLYMLERRMLFSRLDTSRNW
eukprot:GEMP01104242.1.p1 GENE.GEMP01104242.1~~GEMP01104242.1.p1  ORF type:complete len:152 (+),score=47.00 GEMP01104242.1:53-508(+)